MKERNWPYLAGIYDGEGCFHIAKVTPYSKQIAYRLDMHVTTTSFELAKYLKDTFGGNYYFIPSKNVVWKDAWRWQPSGRKNKQNLILGMLPYLIIKKALAEICLEFLALEPWEQNPARREELCLKSREYSRRGKSVTTNTLDPQGKIESELYGNIESASAVMQIA